MKTKNLLSAIVITLLVCSVPGSAEENQRRYQGPTQSLLDLQIGLVPGEVNNIWANHPQRGGDGIWWSTETGPQVGLSYTYSLWSFFSLGAYADYLYLASRSTDSEHHLISIGMTFKFHLDLLSWIQVRLGGGLGTNIMKSDVLDYWGLGTFVGLNVFPLCEFSFAVNQNLALLFGYKFNNSPRLAEGDKVSYPPISIIYLGLEYGK